VRTRILPPWIPNKAVIPRPPTEASDLPTEEELHVEFVTRLKLRGLSDQQIYGACRQQYGIGWTRTKRLIGKVGETFRTRAEARAGRTRAEQIERVRDEIREMREPRFHTRFELVRGVDGRGRMQIRTERFEERLPIPAQLARLEELLADLEGNRAPLKVEMEVTHKNTIVACVAAMPAERIALLQERGLERRRLAEHRQVVGTRVPSELT
jgi:hypothetical protein